jgi:thiamine biosynthesis lipoprotein
MYCNFMSRSGTSSVLAAVLLLAAATAGADSGWYRQDAAIMGTAIHVEVYHEDAALAQRAIAVVLDEMHHIDRVMSPFRPDSELSRVNREATLGPVPVSPELARLIERALQVSELTAGAFDITFASIGYLYDYRDGKRPDAQTVQQTLPAIDYRHVHVDQAAASVAFASRGVRIDLGGIAKGYAVEQSALLLRGMGIRHAMISAGGDTRVIGDRHGRPWLVGIRHPRDEHGILTRLPVQDEAVSTSGDYERFFDEDGVRYHHIIDPATGDSARSALSVTILGPDTTMTDALSTSLFVLGPERGIALIDRLPEYEAVMVDARGGLHYSSGLAPHQP